MQSLTIMTRTIHSETVCVITVNCFTTSALRLHINQIVILLHHHGFNSSAFNKVSLKFNFFFYIATFFNNFSSKGLLLIKRSMTSERLALNIPNCITSCWLANANLENSKAGAQSHTTRVNSLSLWYAPNQLPHFSRPLHSSCMSTSLPSVNSSSRSHW